MPTNVLIELGFYLVSFLGIFIAYRSPERSGAAAAAFGIGLLGVIGGIWFHTYNVREAIRDQADATRDIQERVKSIEEELGDVAVLSGKGGGSKLLVEVVPTYQDFRDVIRREVSRTSGRWWITRLQDRQSSPTEEVDYFETYKSLVLARAIQDVRRLICLPTRAHLDAHVDLIENLGGVEGFELKVWSELRAPVNFELLISDQVAILAFGPGSEHGPPAWGMVVRDERMVTALVGYYKRLWNDQSALTIKARTALTESSISSAVADLQRAYTEASSAGKPSKQKSPNTAVEGDNTSRPTDHGSTPIG